MTDTIRQPDAGCSHRRRRSPRRAEHRPNHDTPHVAAGGPPSTDGPAATRQPAPPGPATQGELERLHASLSAVTPHNHPRTARLLASSTRKIAQKVIEEAGEVALEAVRHNGKAIVRESADLLYHLVALWHRAGLDPDSVWLEMRRRADDLGIAEKLPKARHRNSDVTTKPRERGGDGHGPGE